MPKRLAYYKPRKWVRRKYDEAYFDALTEHAAQLAENVATNAAMRLFVINTDLADLDAAIREYQPKVHGAIVMQRRNCLAHGAAGCLGCPHVRWLQWTNPRHTTFGRRRDSWQAHEIKYPLRKMLKTGAFQENYEVMVALVREAQELMKEKAKLVKQLSNVSRCLAALPANK